MIRTASGTFHDGDLLLNQKGLRLISEEKESRVALLPNIPIYLQFSFILFCRICYLHYHIPSISDEIQFWLCFPLLASALCVYSVFLMLVCDGVDDVQPQDSYLQLKDQRVGSSSSDNYSKQMYSFLPCSNNILGHLFLILVYEFLFHGESYLASRGKQIF